MPKKGSAEDLSVEELRRLLVEKRRASRQERLERFRRTGRVVAVAPDVEGSSLDDIRSGAVPDEDDHSMAAASRSRRKRFFDGLLLAVEILAVIGVLFVLFNGVNLIRELNQEVASALEQPTLTPTPLIMAVVLPSGHTPPTSPGGAQPNEAEIPEHLRPLVQSLANIPIPTPGPEQAIRIQIPAIGIDAPIVQGDGWEQLKKGVGQHVGTSNPGQEGNMVLSAHNDIFGEIFRDLDQLKAGDQVTVHTNQRSYTYVVSGSKMVEPTQVEVMDSTKQPKLTLVSCYPYLVDNQRIVVTARLQSSG
ncbi:MAG TPA: class D sortase [Anaerolineales bacterium]|nr:class D sortase [Anaerolineales bacterium]